MSFLKRSGLGFKSLRAVQNRRRHRAGKLYREIVRQVWNPADRTLCNRRTSILTRHRLNSGQGLATLPVGLVGALLIGISQASFDVGQVVDRDDQIVHLRSHRRWPPTPLTRWGQRGILTVGLLHVPVRIRANNVTSLSQRAKGVLAGVLGDVASWNTTPHPC